MPKVSKLLNHYRQCKAQKRIKRKNRFLNRRARSRINRKINRDRQTQIDVQIGKTQVLMHAIWHGNVSIVARSLSVGVSPNFVDNFETPLLLAVTRFNYYIDEYPEDIVYINNIDFNKFEGVHLIPHEINNFIRARFYIVILLIKYGADINYRDNKGNTILSCAYKISRSRCILIRRCIYFIIKLLNKLGVEQNNINKYDETQILMSGRYNMEDYILLSLRRGANINDIGRYHHNILSRGVAFGHFSTVRLSLNAGGNRFYVYKRLNYIKPEILDIIKRFPSVRRLVNLCLSSIFSNQVPIPEWVPPVLLEFVDETRDH